MVARVCTEANSVDTGDDAAAHASRLRAPVLLIDARVELGRGLADLLTRKGFIADLAVTAGLAAVCAHRRFYQTLIAAAALDDAQDLHRLRQLRSIAPSSWMIVIAVSSGATAREIAYQHGADVCLFKPFRLDELMTHVNLFSHRIRQAV